MKTLQELYTEIMGSDELKKAFVEAAKGGKVADFLKANGCEATAEEIKAFLQEKADQPLSDEELDSAAGGGCSKTSQDEGYLSALTVGLGCIAVGFKSLMDDYIVGEKKEGYDGWLCSSVEHNM